MPMMAEEEVMEAWRFSPSFSEIVEEIRSAVCWRCFMFCDLVDWYWRWDNCCCFSTSSFWIDLGWRRCALWGEREPDEFLPKRS